MKAEQPASDAERRAIAAALSALEVEARRRELPRAGEATGKQLQRALTSTREEVQRYRDGLEAQRGYGYDPAQLAGTKKHLALLELAAAGYQAELRRRGITDPAKRPEYTVGVGPGFRVPGLLVGTTVGAKTAYVDDQGRQEVRGFLSPVLETPALHASAQGELGKSGLHGNLGWDVMPLDLVGAGHDGILDEDAVMVGVPSLARVAKSRDGEHLSAAVGPPVGPVLVVDLAMRTPGADTEQSIRDLARAAGEALGAETHRTHGHEHRHQHGHVARAGTSQQS